MCSNGHHENEQLGGQRIASEPRKRRLDPMSNKLRWLPRLSLVTGVATVTLLCLPCVAHAQSSSPQDRSAAQGPQDRQAGQGDDITRRDLARFDQFLDGHREIANQLRKTPSLIDDPQYLQSHPELNAYLQEHPSVKQEISQNPDTFMSLEDRSARQNCGTAMQTGRMRCDAETRRWARSDADRRNDGSRRRSEFCSIPRRTS